MKWCPTDTVLSYSKTKSFTAFQGCTLWWSELCQLDKSEGELRRERNNYLKRYERTKRKEGKNNLVKLNDSNAGHKAERAHTWLHCSVHYKCCSVLSSLSSPVLYHPILCNPILFYFIILWVTLSQSSYCAVRTESTVLYVLRIRQKTIKKAMEMHAESWLLDPSNWGGARSIRRNEKAYLCER